MNIPKVTSQIASNAQKLVKPLAKPMDNLASSIGKFTDKNNIAKKVVDALELNGGDNQFFGLATIMVFAVLIPRILTALKRNPDNKEATKDEINGILRRDVTTILTMLFALKSMNTVAGNLAGKLSGIPMVHKPYQKLFNEGAQTLGQKAKSGAISLFNNLKDTLNPKGGSKLYTGEDILNEYTGYRGLKGTQNFLETIPEKGGDVQKVFSKIRDSIVAGLSKQISDLENSNIKINDKYTDEVEERLTRHRKVLEYYKNLTFEKFMKLGKVSQDGAIEKMADGAEDELTKFFKTNKNPLARTANAVKVVLQTITLGIETFFLGFGLPSINQKALEKKYLSEKPIGEQRGDNFVPLNDRYIKAQEVKLYGNFLKQA